MRKTSTKSKLTEHRLNEIADAPVAAFAHLSPIKQARLLWLAANSLDCAEAVTAETLAVAHQLASWAKHLEKSVARTSLCECGNARADCVCDQLAAEHYLATGETSQLVGLGWERTVAEALDSGDVTPADLLTSDRRNEYQKGATPVDLRIQSLW